jgi:EmrB/QacA subfamily drug resistance transporter
MEEITIDYSKKWLVMLSVACGVFLSTLDGSIVNIALNTLVIEMDKPLAVVEWVVLAYMLTIATLMLSVGRLADMIGKKRIYLAGLAIFTLGSGLCGLSPDVYWLIGFRVLQAVGASMVMALGTAIVTEAFPSNERGKAMGIMGLMVSIGIIAGPTIGGILLQSLSWHWLFYVNLPVGVIGVILVAVFVPYRRPQHKQRFDFAGAGTLFACMALLLLSLSIIQLEGFSHPTAYFLFAAGAGMLVWFIRIEQRAEQPMIDLNMFTNRMFTINLVTGCLTFIAGAGTTLLMPFFLQNVLGYDPQKTGLMLIVAPMAIAIMAPLSGALSDRMGSRLITTIGLTITAFGYILVSGISATTSAWEYILRYLPIGIGLGIFQSPNNSAVMGSAPKERLGVASGLLALTRVIGQMTGIAILGAVYNTIVLQQSGGIVVEGNVQAPIPAQMVGLHAALLFAVVVLLTSLGFSVWALIQVTRAKKAQRASITSNIE